MCQRGCPTPQPVPVSASSAALYRVRLEPGWRSEYAGIEYAALPVYARSTVPQSLTAPDNSNTAALLTWQSCERLARAAAAVDRGAASEHAKVTTRSLVS